MGIKKHTIVTLGSHSALQILKGAKEEGFKTAIVVTPLRETLYKSYNNFIDEVILINQWADFPKLEQDLIKRNSVIIPHGSFVAYLGLEENKEMKVPYFGNKLVLDWEENRKMQRNWMEESGIKVPGIKLTDQQSLNHMVLPGVRGILSPGIKKSLMRK